MKIWDLVSEDRAVDFDMSDDSNLPDFTDKKYSSKIGTYDGYDIYGSRFYGDQIDAYGILDTSLNPIAVLAIRTKEELFDGKKCQQIEKVWVDKKQRGKALGISLFAFIIRKLKTNLISNKIITADGEKFYKNVLVRKTFDLLVYHEKKRQLLATIPDDLFKIPNDYRIILSQELTEGYDNRLFGHGEKHILNELWHFRNHPTNEWD